MLNELPKKQKVKKPLTKWRLFWRIQKVCFLRAVTPFMMYLFMSLIALAVDAIADGTQIYEVAIGLVCVLAGAAFNAPLAFQYGKLHYDSFLTGEIHRRNAAFGIQSGGDHSPEQEFRWWKGFLIGFYIGIPVIIMGIFAALPATWSQGELALVMFAGWAIFPIQWARNLLYPDWTGSYPAVSGGWSILFVLMPVIVTGVFYIIGAMVQKKKKAEETERFDSADEAGKKK